MSGPESFEEYTENVVDLTKRFFTAFKIPDPERSLMEFDLIWIGLDDEYKKGVVTMLLATVNTSIGFIPGIEIRNGGKNG